MTTTPALTMTTKRGLPPIVRNGDKVTRTFAEFSDGNLITVLFDEAPFAPQPVSAKSCTCGERNCYHMVAYVNRNEFPSNVSPDGYSMTYDVPLEPAHSTPSDEQRWFDNLDLQETQDDFLAMTR